MNKMRSLLVKSTPLILMTNLWIVLVLVTINAEKGQISDTSSIVLHLDQIETTSDNNSEYSNEDASTLLYPLIENAKFRTSAQTNGDTALSEAFSLVSSHLSCFNNQLPAFLGCENDDADLYNATLSRRHIDLTERKDTKRRSKFDDGSIHSKINEEFTCRLYLAESTIPHAGLGIFSGMAYSKNDRLPFIGDVIIPLSPLERSTLISK